jgi:hypothetical protein
MQHASPSRREQRSRKPASRRRITNPRLIRGRSWFIDPPAPLRASTHSWTFAKTTRWAALARLSASAIARWVPQRSLLELLQERLAPEVRELGRG